MQTVRFLNNLIKVAADGLTGGRIVLCWFASGAETARHTTHKETDMSITVSPDQAAREMSRRADGRREIVWGAPLFRPRDARFYAARYIARHYSPEAVQS